MPGDECCDTGPGGISGCRAQAGVSGSQSCAWLPSGSVTQANRPRLVRPRSRRPRQPSQRVLAYCAVQRTAEPTALPSLHPSAVRDCCPRVRCSSAPDSGSTPVDPGVGQHGVVDGCLAHATSLPRGHDSWLWLISGRCVLDGQGRTFPMATHPNSPASTRRAPAVAGDLSTRVWGGHLSAPPHPSVVSIPPSRRSPLWFLTGMCPGLS